MLHDLKLYLVQDEQLHDMNENLSRFYEWNQDKPMTDSRVLNSMRAYKNLKLYRVAKHIFPVSVLIEGVKGAQTRVLRDSFESQKLSGRDKRDSGLSKRNNRKEILIIVLIRTAQLR